MRAHAIAALLPVIYIFMFMFYVYVIMVMDAVRIRRYASAFFRSGWLTILSAVPSLFSCVPPLLLGTLIFLPVLVDKLKHKGSDGAYHRVVRHLSIKSVGSQSLIHLQLLIIGQLVDNLHPIRVEH